MNAKLALVAIWALAAVPLLRLMSVWDSIPERVAVHFGISGEPNGWSSKSALPWLVAFPILGQATLATFLIIRLGAHSPLFPITHALITFVLVCAFWQMIEFNANKTPFRILWVIGPLVLMFGMIAFNLVTRFPKR
ncbi:MAG TPA: DUF1648 domain-containing protein [Alphaproteobacteria bacterium]|nr:DUF1648 domain-containing protein [Alphaproteobacteria bacterium]